MQYILTEDEYSELQRRARSAISINQKKLQELCTRICDTMPVDWGWTKGDAPKPWGCIITVEQQAKKTGEYAEWYCDKCPVHDICPYQHKSHSK